MKTKKVVKRKLNIKKFLILLLVFYLVIYGTYYLFSAPIKNIIITGNEIVKDYEIIELANIKNYPSVFSLRKTKLIKNIKTNPLINNVKIKRNLKFQLFIDIEENKVVLHNKSNNKYILSNGNYLENDNKYLGIPTLNNYTPEETLKSFASELGKLDTSIINMISEVEYTPSKNKDNETIDNTRFKLLMNDGNTVYINVKKCNILSYYDEIYASLNDKKGVLELDSGNYDNFRLTLYEK